ncbi:hypothetical protein [Chromobacterium sp. IIBBL 290-4]|uniref:hypothetical protein n=1 Tax=Chromobacterium sp. IIBBL 290-4 TaxID=2953890 RepID=UPI0020B6CA5D|nr:hypothetical protein [Chromobacterium sp. IIBBL 290-4]UTH74012.1 hypothetical protein NKT35_21085 [Chromobacterium sp. IIBBL 290-4]
MAIIPDDFTPPRSMRFADFRLETLGPDYAEADYQAVSGSSDAIRHVFGPDNHWPPAKISFEENLADLRRHLQEFEQRQAFAYSLLAPDSPRYLGCLYLKPIKSRLENDWRKQRFQAQAFLWLNADDKPLSAEKTVATLQNWLTQDWPFAALAWPGRDMKWEEWLSTEPITP